MDVIYTCKGTPLPRSAVTGKYHVGSHREHPDPYSPFEIDDNGKFVPRVLEAIPGKWFVTISTGVHEVTEATYDGIEIGAKNT